MFKEFYTHLQNDLQTQVDNIFKMTSTEEVKFIPKQKLFTKKKKEPTVTKSTADTYWMEVPIHNKQDELLGTIEDVLEYITSEQEEIGGMNKKTIRKMTIDEKMPDVLLMKYKRFNSSGKKILKQDIKCGSGINFNNIYYKLKGVIVHEGDSIEKGKYIGIIQDNSTDSWEMIDVQNLKGNPSNLKLINQAYVLLFERNGVENEHQEEEHQQEQQEQQLMEERKDQEHQEQEEEHQQEQQEHHEQQEQELMKERKDQGLPRMQQLLRLENPLNVCYANAGTNALISSPCVTRFLSSLPNDNGEFHTVRQLVICQPGHVTNLTELRNAVTRNTNINFNRDNRQQDASEWIMALYNTIKSMLNGDLQKNFKDLFILEFTITFECSWHQHQSQQKKENIILELPVVDQEGHPILTLNEILKKHFEQEVIKKECDTCDSNSANKTEIITVYPQVLLLQYMRFNNQGQKINHNIICGTSLKLNNVTYKLTGIVVHQGSSIKHGHYYTITRCWETGNAYKLNDSYYPEML